MSFLGVRFSFARSSSLTTGERDALWRVYSTFFETARARFDETLNRADEVVRYFDPHDRRLCGMALVSAFSMSHQGREFRVLSTGAVCVEPGYRGFNATQRAGLYRLALERVRHPLTDVFWYFDTFSFKSYVLLSRNVAVYWPRRDRITPDWESGVIALLAQKHGGGAWNADMGIIKPQGRRLRPGIADAPPEHPDPDVQFFLQRNPGYAVGDRLPCLCPLNARNVAAIAWRAARRAARRA